MRSDFPRSKDRAISVTEDEPVDILIPCVAS